MEELFPFFGNIVNFLAIIIGSILGLLLGRRFRSEWTKNVLQGIGLFALVIGISLAFQLAANWGQALVCLFSIVVGGIIGEILDIELRLEVMGFWFANVLGVGEEGNEERSRRARRFNYGFISSSLIFCLGPLSIVGSIAEASGDPSFLFTKSAIDGTLAILFSSTMGVGVLFSAFIVFIYQAILEVGYSLLINTILTEEAISVISGVGGVLLLGVGVNLLGLGERELPVANFLPALIVASILILILPYIFDFIKLFIPIP